MRNRNYKMKNRIMAMGLTMCMMINPLAGYVPGEYVVYADETAENAASADDTKGVEISDGAEIVEPADSAQIMEAEEASDEDFASSGEKTILEAGEEFLLDKTELPGEEAAKETIQEDFRLTTVCEGVTFFAAVRGDVFPEGAKLSVEKTDEAAISLAVEEAVGAEGACTHRQYNIKVTDDQDRTLQFEKDAVSVQVEGLEVSDGVRVAVYDTEKGAADEIEVRIDTERNAIEFALTEAAVLDIFTIAPPPEQTEENAVKEEILNEELPEIPSGDIEEPIDTLAIEEPVDELTIEEPVDELTIEEPVDELTIEEPVDTLAIEEPVDELTIEEPVDELTIEEPVDTLVIEEPVGALAMPARASAAGEEENSEIDFSGDTYEEDEEEEVEPDESYDDWEELQEAIENAEEGAIFALNDELDADEPLLIPAGQTITLDLNGCELGRSLRRPEKDGCVIIVEGNLTLIDQAGGGRITGGNNTGDGGGIYVAEGGSLTLRGAVIEDNSCEGKGGGVYAAGDFTLKSGEISSNKAEDEGGGVYFENTFAMKGGSLSANTPEDVYLDKAMTVSGNAQISNAFLALTDTAGFFIDEILGNRARISVNLNQTAVGEKNVPVTNGLKDRGTLENFRLNKKGDCNLVLDAAGEAVICKYAIITFLAGNGTNATKQESVIPGSDYTLPECDFFTDPQGRPFQAWLLEDGTIKKPGEVIHVTESLSATVQWALTWSEVQDRIKAAGWNDTIKVPGSLTRQTAEDVLTIPADKKITLDLAGCTLDGAGIGDQPVIYVEGALILTDSIGGGRITGGSAGGIVVNGGSFSLQKGEISGNTSKELGGGVLVKSGSFTMDGTGASVSGNTAQNGGGIGVSGGSFVLNKGNVTGNTAAEGGGVAVTGGKLTLSGGRIGNNTAGNGGGVSVLSGGSITIQSGTISGNTASANGGGLLLQGGAKASLSGGTIEKNSAKSQGGGLYLDGGDLTLRGTDITGNDASTGGGIAAYNSTFMLDSGNISFNTAASQGGGLYIRKGEASLNGGSVTGNTAGYGGGMFLGESTLVMPKNIITQNTAGAGGAGVAFSDMTLQLPALACVKNNRIGSGEADYWLQDGAVFDVTTQLDASYKVYVSAEMKQGESRIIAIGEKLSRDNFISADTGYVSSRNAGGDIILGEPITVRFDAGDGSGTMADDIVARGGNYTLPQAKGLTAPDGLELQGWAIDKDDYWDHKTKAVGYNLSVEDELLTEGVLKLTACWGKGTLYVDENGTNHVAALVYPLTDYQSQGAVTLETGWYLADGAVFDQRVTIDGDVNIIIDNVHTTAMNKSILLPEGSKLSVWGEGGWETASGKLVVAGGTNGNAAIGGTTKRMPGTFVLRSGEVEAAGSTNAAGIGGGNGTNGGSVVIHGGKLTAKGGANAAGIGGGMGGGQGGMVSIYGGTVYAYGGAKAAGIGGGSEGNGGQVAVIGATVSAQGGISGAGIGGGSGGNGGSVSVSVGATVTALAGKNPYENSASDKQPQAIGRGFMTGNTVLNGTLTLTESCYVDAGESASTAVKYTTGREDACRQPYAKVNPTAGLPTVFPINKKDVDLELASVFIYKASDLKKKESDPKSSLKEVNEAEIQDEIAVKIVPNGSYHHYDGIEIQYSYHGENLELTDYQVSEGVDKDEKENQYPYTLVTFKMPMGEVTVAPKIKTDTYQITVNVVDGQGTGYAAVENVPATEAEVGKEVILHCTSAGSGWFLDVQQRSNQPESEYTPHVSWFDSEKQETVVEKTAGVGEDAPTGAHEDISNKEILRSFTMPAGDVTVDLTFRKGVNYYDQDGVRKLANYYHTVSEDDTEWSGGGVEDNFYYVGESMTLKNRVKLGCQVNLILGPGVTLTCEKGLQVSEKNGGKLYLHEEVKDGGSHLSCDASDEDKCAGIGGNDGETGGTVVICGGKVTAKGGYKAAGIGGGNHGALLEYKQYGGNVTAEGGKYGAGVGGGEGYDGSVEDGISDEVNIYGGELHATGGSYGAGIGGGQSMNQGKAVKIHNGMVYATGGRDAAGIGGGEEFSGSSRDVGGNGGEVYVYDGYVEAKGGGGEGGAGIGGGQDGKGKKFVMTGGEVHAEGGDDSAGIGGSNQDGGDVEISGGWVYAKGGTDGAGIGGGDDHAFGTITISGGYVEAEGGKNGAGIGTGCWGEGGTINLYGGEVHADGGTNAAGVGGGSGNWWWDADGHVDTITLRCCDLYAYGDFCAVGPGRWWAGKYYLYWRDGDISVGNTKGSATEYVSKNQLKELSSHKYAEYIWSVKETRNTYTEQLWGEGQYFYGTWYSAKEYHSVNIFNESANVHVRKPEKHNLVPYPGDTQPARMYCPDCGYFVQCAAIFHRDNDPDGEVFTESHVLNGKYVMPKYAWTVPEGNEFIGWRSGDTVVKPGETYLFTKDGENIYPVFEHRHEDQIFQAWESTNSLPASGSYYLLNDVDLGKKTWSVTSPVHLCLNGKTIRNAAISVASELTISDDAGEGSLAASSTVTVLSGSTFNLEDARSSARTEVQSGAECNLINGEIRGVSGGYAVRVDGTLNLIGGQITGNSGGGVYASSGAMVRMGDIDTASIIYNQGTAGQRESAKKSYGFRFASITGNTRDGGVCNVYLEPGSSFEGVFDDDDSSQGSLFSNLHAKQLVLVNELPIRETRREAGSKGREEGCRLWNRSDDLRDFQYIYVFGSTMTFDLTGMETDFSVDPMEGYLDTENGKDQIVLMLPGCTALPNRQGVDYLKSWVIGSKTYQPGDSYTLKGNVTVTATHGFDWYDLQTWLDESSPGSVIKLPVDLDSYLNAKTKRTGFKVTKDVTIDLNGKKIICNYTLETIFTVDGAALTLKDSAGGGQITGSTQYVFDVVNGGTVHMEGGQIDHCTSVIASVQKGTFDMTGGTITANTIRKGRLIEIQDGIFQISGSPVIDGNNVIGAGRNYQLEAGETNRIIHVTGPLSADARIGIYSDSTENVVITSELSGNGTAENFFSNVNGKTISLNEKGEAVWTDAPAFRTYALLPSPENAVNVYLELPEINGVDYTDSYMEFRMKDSEKKTVTRALYDPEKRDAGGNGWYGFTCYADYPRVDGSITAVFHYGEGMTVEKTYSVRDLFFPDMLILSFDANGGSGEMASVSAKRSASYTLPECGFTAPGKVFAKWYVYSGSYNGPQQPGDVITVTSDTTIQARWESAVTIRFDANGGSGEMASVAIAQSASYTLPECGFTAAKGMQFAGWQVNQDTKNIRQPGDVITVDDDLTLTAIWKHMHDGLTFSPWDKSNELPVSDYWSTLNNKERNYYLTKDVVLFKKWEPYVDVNLCLNGHTITFALGSGIVLQNRAVNIYDCDEEGGGCIITEVSGGKCVTVSYGGTLTLYGGSILSGGSDNVVINDGYFVMKGGVVQSTSGRAVNNLTGGRFRMEGGTIKGGSIEQSFATFEMRGGTIDGSQVELSDGFFEMYGGAIEHATVNVWGKMFMSGGSISGAAEDYAVNVYDRGRFDMYGGEITGNTGGGVHVASKAEVFLLQGEVTGNTKDGKPCNVYLEKDAKLSIPSYIQSDSPARFGISTAVAPTKEKPVVITSGLKRNETVGKWFLSDNESYRVKVNFAGEAELGFPTTVTFDANGGSGSMASAVVKDGKYGGEYTLPGCGFDAPFGMKFAGWQLGDDPFAYQPGEVVYFDEDLTIKALWEEDVDITWDNLQQWIDNRDPESVIRLSADLDSYSSTTRKGFRITKPLTIDLNGNDIICNRALESIFTVDGTVLILKDSAGGGQITGSTKNVFDVVNNGAVRMEGGQIDHCTSTIASVQKGLFDMTGGTITANTLRKGRLIDIQDGIFQISGSPVIEGNNAGGTGRNYQLEAGETNRIIRVTGPLSADARIGIYSSSSENVVITGGLYRNGTAKNFFTNVDGKSISLNKAGEAVLENTAGESGSKTDGTPSTGGSGTSGTSSGSGSGTSGTSSGGGSGTSGTSSGSGSGSVGTWRAGGSGYLGSGDGAQTSGDQIPVLFGKALTTVSVITSRQNGLDAITKARYGEEDDQAAGEIYVLDEEVPLEKDVPLDEDLLKKYLLWTNVQTQHDMYLLPNATRLYRGTRLDYVSEVIRGNVLGDSDEYTIDIFTALNDNAYQHPVIPIGSTGSLDFATGIFSVPELADFELYLHEVSGEWLIEKFDEGFLRRLDADQDEVNAYAQADSEEEVGAQAEAGVQEETSVQAEAGARKEASAQAEAGVREEASAQAEAGVREEAEIQAENTKQAGTLPQGEIVEGLTADGGMDGRKKYWVGITPENAADDAQSLVYLLVNEETDEIDAFRTSRRMIAAGDEDVDVSLYLYRDSKSDRMGEEKYNVMFFDTPEGEKSLVKVITDVLEDRELEIPKTLRIVLRGFRIDGADDTDYPVYSLTDHFFAMNDGTDGEVSMFDGFYTASIDENTFESTYTRIESVPDQDTESVPDQDTESIPDQDQDGSSKDDSDQGSDDIPDDGLDGDLKVTVKKDQPIWPEWTSGETSSDIGGGEYVLVDGEWLSYENYEKAKTTA